MVSVYWTIFSEIWYDFKINIILFAVATVFSNILYNNLTRFSFITVLCGGLYETEISESLPSLFPSYLQRESIQ